MRARGLLIVGVMAALVTAPLGATAASAHDSLVESSPGADQTVTALTAVELTFSADPIDRDGADLIQVKGPDGRYYETACPSLAGPLVSTPVEAGPSGTYEVLWRVVSSDGHPVSNTFTFTYDAPAGAAVAKGASAPACGGAADAATDAAAPVTDSGGSSGLWIGLGAGAVVVVVVGVVAYLLMRRPRDDE